MIRSIRGLQRRRLRTVAMGYLFTGLLVATGCDSQSAPADDGNPVVAEPSESNTDNTGNLNPAAQDNPVGEFVPESDAADEAAEVSDADFHEAGAALPRPDDIPAWFYLETPAYYSTSNLAELIDGGSASYLAMGFEQCAYGVLQLRESPPSITREVGLEIYIFRMTTPDIAEQKYLEDHEGSTCAEAAPFAGSTHCLGSANIDLLQGPYYLRFNLDAQDPALIEPLIEVARGVVERLRDATQNTRPVPGEGPQPTSP